jgi:plasmid stabilization system protein ParE
MSERLAVVFLVDVDNTLLDNDHIQNDLREHLEREFGAACRDRYWKILETLFEELGYRDYLGALQRYRIEHPTDIRLLRMSSYLVDYPFADRLYPGALDVLNRLRSWGQTVILSDGDVVFQPRKRVFKKSRFCHISPTMFSHSDFQTAGANPGQRTVSLDLPGLFKHPLRKIGQAGSSGSITRNTCTAPFRLHVVSTRFGALPKSMC